jgi:hypothetical protein
MENCNRDEYPGWCTPNIYKDGNEKVRIAVNGYKHRGGYDFSKPGKKYGKCQVGEMFRFRHQL